MPNNAQGPIVVLGSVNMDLTGTTARFPRPGETVLGHTFSMSQGGKGGNQAIAAARAGGTVELLAAVGSDAFSSVLRDAVSTAGVSPAGLRQVAGSSGVALITVSGSGENTIVVLPGANTELTELTDAELDIIRRAGMLLCQLEIPLATVVAGARAAAAAGVPVLLNPSPAAALPDELTEAVTLIVLNQEEARTLGAPALEAIPHVITTLGAGGAEYRDPKGGRFRVEAPKVEVVDTTGAGDVFTGALAVSWSRGDEALDALRFACAAGALATTAAGAGASSPAAAQIDELKARTWGS